MALCTRMFVFQQKFVNWVLFAIAVFLFCGSMISQIVLDKQPCQLCLISRYLFLSIALVALFLRRSKLLCPILCFIAVAFSLYHLGVESHWWKAPHGCIVELPTLDVSQNADLLSDNVSFCDRVNWTILGISSTLWSFLFSMFLFWLSSTASIVRYYLKKLTEYDD